MTSSVPANPAAIDSAWLGSALEGAPSFAGAEILGVEARVIGEGFGLDGTVARLDLVTRGGTPPRSLVAKLASAERGREEIDFYEGIAPRMPVRLAAYHAGFVDETQDRAVLLLEDLSHARQGDVLVGATRAQAERLLDAMALFHAAFYEADGATLPLTGWEGREESLVRLVTERGPRFLERYGATLDDRVRARVAELPTLLPEAVARLAAAPRTLIHSDLHLDNVLFLEDGEPVILDWPHACRGPGTIDVVRLLVEGLSAEVRRRHVETLLDVYAEARSKAGRPCAPPAALRAEVRAALLWHLAYALLWAGAEDPGFDTPRVREIVDSLVRNVTSAARDLLP